MTDDDRPYRWRAPANDAGDDVFAARYPDTTIPEPPAELGWRARRRFRASAHRARRRDTAAQVASWRQVEPTVGLAVALLIAGLLFAVWMNWPRSEPAPAPEPDGPAAAATDVAPSTPRSNEEGTSLGTDHEHELPAGPPGLFDDAAGRTVHEFAVAYAAYSPAVPAPVDAWVDSWSQWATDALHDQARIQAADLWDFTVRQEVHVIDPVVTSGTRDGDTWQLQVTRRLFPVGGTEASTTQPDVVTLTVGLVEGKVGVAALAR